ncbi:MAG: copper-binding protein [Burkholderiaceae bacterium]|jgi:Cu/Ag efflux protein CusF|nr:copper-binding protein [Burkholderiaceae bacterium]
MKQIFLPRLAAVIAVAVAPALVWAGSTGHGGSSHSSHGDLSSQQSAATTPATAAEFSSGEVRRIDREQKKITLRHGEIKNLEMPPMTMVFQVKDSGWLDRFKVGDKVNFRAENINGAITLTELQPAP